MEIEKEREAFECWFESRYDAHFMQFALDLDMYVDKHTQTCWEAWQAAKAQAVPKWISTSDRMPEEGEEVLVHSYGQVRQATRDSSWAGGFKERNCYGWQATYGQSHWMPKSIRLPESFHFYYEHDAKVAEENAMIEAQEQANESE